MPNETIDNNVETSSNPTIKSKVNGFRLKAREILRQELIAKRLEKAGNLKANKESAEKCLADVEMDFKVAEYERSKVDVNHPRFDAKKHEEAGAQLVKNYEAQVKRCKESIEEADKAIKENEEGIAKIESGETKVSLERLNDLALAMATDWKRQYQN